MGLPLGRAFRITSVLNEEGLGFVAAKLGLDRDSRESDTDTNVPDLAVRLRRICERLGPVFVKFGQILSVRKDIIPEDIANELAKLQSNVTPFENSVAKEIIAEELGQPIEEIFAEVSDVPIAAASLAQVYAAKLRDGTDVVLKVRRPDAVEKVTSDTDLLLFFSKQLHRLIPQYRAQQVHRVAEEFVAEARKELDFLNEAHAAIRFAEILEDDPDFYVPKTYRNLSTNALIVMERLGGTRLDRVDGPEELRKLGMEPSKLVDALLRTSMEQTFLHGLLHADLHPGNVFVLPEGKIGLIDFGMHGEFDRVIQNKLIRIMMYRATNKHEECAEAVLETYHALPNADHEAFRQDIIAMGKKIETGTVETYTIGQALQDEGKFAAKHNFVAPEGVLMFGRALIVTEGIALKFTPDLNFPDKLQPIFKTILMKRMNFSGVLTSIESFLPELFLQLEHLPKLVRRVMAAERRFAESGSLDEAITGLVGAKRREKSVGGLGPWFAATALWGIAAYLCSVPAGNGVPTVAGVSWVGGAFLAAAVSVTAILLMRKS